MAGGTAWVSLGTRFPKHLSQAPPESGPHPPEPSVPYPTGCRQVRLPQEATPATPGRRQAAAPTFTLGKAREECLLLSSRVSECQHH